MLSSQEEQEERKRVTLQDADLRRQQQEQSQRDQSGTFFSHAAAEANVDLGRFGTLGNPTVVGAEPAVKYPQLPSSSPWSGSDPVPTEPPLGFRIDAMPELEPEPFFSASSVQATGGAPSSPCEDVVAPPSSPVGGPAPVSHLPPGPARMTRDVGPPSNKDDDNG
jgi:hypothetical protein